MQYGKGKEKDLFNWTIFIWGLNGVIPRSQPLFTGNQKSLQNNLGFLETWVAFSSYRTLGWLHGAPS